MFPVLLGLVQLIIHDRLEMRGGGDLSSVFFFKHQARQSRQVHQAQMTQFSQNIGRNVSVASFGAYAP